MIQVLCGKYDARALAFRITYQNEAIRATDAYEEELDRVYEATMSCDRQEAIMWTIKFMENAIRYGIATRNLDWKVRFLAAYDVCRGL